MKLIYLIAIIAFVLTSTTAFRLKNQYLKGVPPFPVRRTQTETEE